MSNHNTTIVSRITEAYKAIPLGWEIQSMLLGPEEALALLEWMNIGDRGPWPADVDGIPAGNQDQPGLTLMLRHKRQKTDWSTAVHRGPLKTPLGYTLTEAKTARKLKQFPFNHE